MGATAKTLRKRSADKQSVTECDGYQRETKRKTTLYLEDKGYQLLAVHFFTQTSSIIYHDEKGREKGRFRI